ncbi:hypothetical protein BDZ91DRAFT_738357 [Kalaharituber pfeilii]|nr:hypothetical protein BDZ91DRAFT_738357 [Kalaharituber pfeilii]
MARDLFKRKQITTTTRYMCCPRCSYMMRVSIQGSVLHFPRLSGSYGLILNHFPPSLTLSTSVLSSKYTTAELVFFPSSSSKVFFLNHLIPTVFPRPEFPVSNQRRTFPRSFLRAIPCTTTPCFEVVASGLGGGAEGLSVYISLLAYRPMGYGKVLST